MYILYILKCSDNSFYTGITNDLAKRLAQHASGKGAKYVRAHLPFTLAYQEQFENRSEVQKREYEIKQWSREKKIKELHLGVESSS
jgi:putative endonuclease